MKDRPGRIGIDIGAVSLKAVRLDTKGQVVSSFYARHRGDPAKALEAAMATIQDVAARAIKPGRVFHCGLVLKEANFL